MRPMPPPLGAECPERGPGATSLGPPPNSNFPKLVVLDEARWRWVEGEGARGHSSGPNVESLAPFAPRLRALLRAPPPPLVALGDWGGCEALPGIWNREAGRSGGSGVHRGREAGAERHPVGAAGRSKKRQASSSPKIFVRPVPDIPSQRSRQRQKSRQVETGLSGSHQRGQGREGRARAGRVHRPGRALRAHSARPPRARRAAKEEGGDLGRGPAAEARARREGREGRGPQWRGPALRPPPPPPPP